MPVFEDGVRSTGSTMVDGIACEVVELGTSPHDDVHRPASEAVGWILRCECRPLNRSGGTAWEDPTRWVRVPSASLEDLDRRRLFAADEDVSDAGMRPDVAENARAAWRREHLDPSEALDAIHNAAADRSEAERKLDAAVAAARQHGHSWADIGQAAGMTRQSANERWRNRT